MERGQVLVVVGSCSPERAAYSAWLGVETGGVLVPAGGSVGVVERLDVAASLAGQRGDGSTAVVEFSTKTDLTEVIGAFSGEGGGVDLGGIHCVVDAMHLRRDLESEEYVFRASELNDGTGWLSAQSLLTAVQMEFASEVVLVNWESLPTQELSTVMGLAAALAPVARVRLHSQRGGGRWQPSELVRGRGVAPESVEEVQQRPGWLRLLNGEHAPRLRDPRVGAFVYENLRPFHPKRLQNVLDRHVETGTFGTVVRSAGFCRFATRPHVVGRWEHVGRMLAFEPLARATEEAEVLALGQEIAIIGLDLDRTALTQALDSAVLDDEEFAAGPELWARLDDPFPAWPVEEAHRGR